MAWHSILRKASPRRMEGERELSVDQLLTAVIPAGILGGFVLGPPSLAAAHLVTPDFFVLHAAARTGGA